MSDKVLLKPPGKKLPEPPGKSSIIIGAINHKYFEKALTFLGVILTIYIASVIFSNAEFLIKPSPNGIELTTYDNLSTLKSSSLYGPELLSVLENLGLTVQKNITIKAENCYSIKPYNSPIYLNYSFIYENGTKRDVKEISVRASRRSIVTGKDYSTLNIALAGYPTESEYLLRVWGRGGGESVSFEEGPFQSPKVIVSGREPIHHCTITITIEKRKGDPVTDTL
jgi:hypothetical protein